MNGCEEAFDAGLPHDLAWGPLPTTEAFPADSVAWYGRSNRNRLFHESAASCFPFAAPAACERENRRLVDFLNETRPSCWWHTGWHTGCCFLVLLDAPRWIQDMPIGQPPHLWPYPHPATGFVLFGAGWSVCVCASFVLLFFVFFVMGWFGLVS